MHIEILAANTMMSVTPTHSNKNRCPGTLQLDNNTYTPLPRLGTVVKGWTSRQSTVPNTPKKKKHTRRQPGPFPRSHSPGSILRCLMMSKKNLQGKKRRENAYFHILDTDGLAVRVFVR